MAVTECVHDGDLSPLIQRVATGPNLSKDLTRDEARQGLAAVLGGQVPPVQSAIFLIALRMKRESDDENLGMLEALLDASRRVEADVPLLVDVSEPYDGFSKVLPVTAFLAPVLAACGVAAVSHGVDSVGPKYGVTHARVLAAAGVAVDLDPQQAAARIEQPGLGWSYVDQSSFCPALHRLGELRRLMVKRTALSTLERVMAPVRAGGRSQLLAGYVHTAYPPVYEMLARLAGFDAVILVRGVEGGVTASPRQPGQAWVRAGDQPLERVVLDPADAGVRGEGRGVPVPGAAGEAAGATVEAGLAALDGAAGAAREVLSYAGAVTLWQAGVAPDLTAGAAAVRDVLDSGAARARLEAARG